MIKLDRLPEPPILSTEGANWLTALQNAIAKYGSYKLIPTQEREALAVHYRHKQIQETLSISSHGKCAFCECHPAEGGYLQVEHFQPKSIYPDTTFEWKNLLPACGPCNISKSDHDTAVEPLLNPYDADPTDYFDFEGISVLAKIGKNYEVSRRTIEVCSLEGIRLWKPRADILISLKGFSQAIEQALKDLEEADSQAKRTHRKRRLNEALLTIETLALPNSKFSAFCKSFLAKCDIYIKAKQVVSTP